MSHDLILQEFICNVREIDILSHRSKSIIYASKKQTHFDFKWTIRPKAKTSKKMKVE